ASSRSLPPPTDVPATIASRVLAFSGSGRPIRDSHCTKRYTARPVPLSAQVGANDCPHATAAHTFPSKKRAGAVRPTREIPGCSAAGKATAHGRAARNGPAVWAKIFRERSMSSRVLRPLFVAGAMVLAGCGASTSGNGTLAIALTDAPSPDVKG